MQSLALYIGFGLVTASILCIGAVSFTLQFGISNLFNLAFGATLTAAAFVAYVCNAAGLNIWVSLVFGSLAASLLSFLLNRGIYTPFKRRATSMFTMIMVTLGVGIIIQYGIEAIWGADNFSYNMATGRAVHVADMLFTTTQLTVIVIAAVAATLVHILLRYTRLGKAMRAVAVNERLARNCGIPVRAVIDSTWLISGALCGLTGVALVMDVQVLNSSSGDDFLILIVAATVLGGIGSAYGAMVGSVIIGVVAELTAGFINPQFKDISAFIILAAVLLLRPNGVISSIASAKEMAR
ncbi:MAG TPA: branched-chain amino acid ABC transporter permease [Candidatus Dormibacteraeota bacterium]|nr:branched-chain amino acid ABC transporter permease [Candidatus Dormibacteraeota bacterium]